MEEEKTASFPFWRERGTSLRLVESRIHFVRTKENIRIVTNPPFIKIFRFPTQISILISLICLFLINYIHRPFLGFEIGLSQILSQDACAEELNSAHKKDDADGRCPALDWIAYDELSDDYEQDSCKGKETGKKTKYCGGNQRHSGKSDDAVHCIEKKFPEGPFGFTGYAFYIFIGEPFGMESHPAKEPLGETIVFRQFQKGIDEFSVRKPIISGSVNQFRVGNSVHQTIEKAGKKKNG